MGPRKNSKPSQKAGVGSQDLNADKALESNLSGKDTRSLGSGYEESEAKGFSRGPEASTQVDSRKTWYGGTWPRTPKATPVTQVVKESISATTPEYCEAISSAQRHISPYRETQLQHHASYLSKDKSNSSRSLPLTATATRVNIASDSPDTISTAERVMTRTEAAKGNAKDDDESSRHPSNAANSYSDKESRDEYAVENKPKSSCAAILDAQDRLGPEENSSVSSRWFGWFARSIDSRSETPVPRQELSSVDQPSDDIVIPDTALKADRTEPSAALKRRRNSDPKSSVMAHDSAPRSWFGLWSNPDPVSQNIEPESTANKSLLNAPKPPEISNLTDEDQVQKFQTPGPSSQALIRPDKHSKSYGWAFWTSDPVRPDDAGTAGETNIGMAALAGSVSPSRPTEEVDKTTAPGKVGTQQGLQLVDVSTKTPTKTPESTKEAKKTAKTTISASSRKTEKNEAASVKPNHQRINLLLPSLDSTYTKIRKPGLVQQLGLLILSRKTLNDAKHVYLQDAPRIKRAVAIGVHGYFPTPLIRSVLGQPTGTSIRFANGAGNAIERWTAQSGYSCEIEKVALEGEGKIAERLDILWKLLLNWIEDIRKADFVMIACHSQGVPVAIMLVSKLISFGCLQGARVGVCAMAGVNLGPFGDYKSRWISGVAGELFDFAQPDSQVSKDYAAALNVSLRFGTRLTFVGSLDDQLVSLESSTFGNLVHPYIYRAVFVDGRVHAPDFLSHLVGFVLRLRNLGLTDHGLIRELSTPLAGSLYGGEGHSRIYDDAAVYSLALRYTLESSSVGDVPPKFVKLELNGAQNPYILPFAMRGLLEEDYVKSELRSEITELLRQFDDWKPSSKILKDVKFRLEGVRSRL